MQHTATIRTWTLTAISNEMDPPLYHTIQWIYTQQQQLNIEKRKALPFPVRFPIYFIANPNCGMSRYEKRRAVKIILNILCMFYTLWDEGEEKVREWIGCDGRSRAAANGNWLFLILRIHITWKFLHSITFNLLSIQSKL